MAEMVASCFVDTFFLYLGSRRMVFLDGWANGSIHCQILLVL